MPDCQTVQDSDVENANSRETSIKRASKTETPVALLMRAFFDLPLLVVKSHVFSKI
jgi:hypothetical protein